MKWVSIIKDKRRLGRWRTEDRISEQGARLSVLRWSSQARSTDKIADGARNSLVGCWWETGGLIPLYDFSFKMDHGSIIRIAWQIAPPRDPFYNLVSREIYCTIWFLLYKNFIHFLSFFDLQWGGQNYGGYHRSKRSDCRHLRKVPAISFFFSSFFSFFLF